CVNLPQERGDRLAPVVRVVSQQVVHKGNAVLPRADGDGTDHGDATVRVRDAMDWRLATRGEGASNDRFKHKPRLIDEDGVGSPRCRLFHDQRELLTDPGFDGGIVAIRVLQLWPLAGPVQLRIQDSADVGGVIVYAKILLDDLAD